MIQRFVFYLFACGPLILTLAAWLKLFLERRKGWPRPIALIALAVTCAVAVYSAVLTIYFAIRPTPPRVPPWEDSFVLDMAMLFLLAPIAGILGLVLAGKRAGPGWLIAVIEIASVPLLLLGVIAVMEV